MVFPPTYAVTVDIALLTIRDGALCALAVRRGEPPYRGRWALPGGYVLPAEAVEDAALRELREETGLSSGFHLEQLATYGDPGRDPRQRTVTVAHLALAPDLTTPVAGTDAAEAEWRTVDRLLSSRPTLAFDHRRILADALERARAKLEYTPLATAFCPEEFTIGELRRVYEAVWGLDIDPRNFHRKVSKTVGFLLPTGSTTTRDGGRPARLYRRGTLPVLSPPLTREGR